MQRRFTTGKTISGNHLTGDRSGPILSGRGAETKNAAVLLHKPTVAQFVRKMFLPAQPPILLNPKSH
jgi:hypothetical protein